MAFQFSPFIASSSFHYLAEAGARSSAAVVLTPPESKRLIAKGVAALPSVKQALQKGRIIIATGTSNAFVAEEILGVVLEKNCYSHGIISGGELTSTRSEVLPKPYVLVDGKLLDIPFRELLKEFDANDVFIKGANAVDLWGNVGILMADPEGGTIGAALPIVVPRGAHLLAPVGLEKMIPSVVEASRRCGQLRWRHSTGLRVGLMPLVNAEVVTEVQALKVLTGAEATHVASGGIEDSVGAVVLGLEGTEEQVSKAFELVLTTKEEHHA